MFTNPCRERRPEASHHPRTHERAMGVPRRYWMAAPSPTGVASGAHQRLTYSYGDEARSRKSGGGAAYPGEQVLAFEQELFKRRLR